MNNKIEIKSCQATRDLFIKGYASVFNQPDSHGDIITKAAFTDAMTKSPNQIKFLWQHDSKNPIGIIEKMQIDDYGLFIEARITSGTRMGSEASDLLKKGIIDGLSIGFNVVESSLDNNNRRIINNIDLWEISLVTFPANNHARILDTKNKQTSITKEEEMNNLLEVNMPVEYQHQDHLVEFVKGDASPNVFKSFSQDQQEMGGFAVVSERYKGIISQMTSISPMRQIADCHTISSNALDLLIQKGEFESGWVAEREIRVDTRGSKILQKRIMVHEVYAQPKATQRLLDDAYVNIENWITEQLVHSFATKENASFINGDGENKPRGILTYDEIERVRTEEQEKITLRDILNLLNSLDEPYHANSCFLMNRRVFGELQNIRDSNERFIIQASVTEKTPTTLFGIPVYLSSDMPVPGSGRSVIALGDFKQAYKIVDRHGISIMKDPFTEKPYTKFYATKRVGGDVVNFDAIKLLNISGSYSDIGQIQTSSKE